MKGLELEHSARTRFLWKNIRLYTRGNISRFADLPRFSGGRRSRMKSLGKASIPPSRPHIVFTLVDDWGYELWPRRNSAGAVHKELLPHLQMTFVDEGVELARHYTYSYCAPSRQSLLSGRQPLHVNEENSVCSGIPRGMRTIGDVVKAAGCTCSMPERVWGV